MKMATGTLQINIFDNEVTVTIVLHALHMHFSFLYIS